MITTINDIKLLYLFESSYNIKIDRKTIFSYIEWYNTCRDLYPGYSKKENDFTDAYFFDTKEIAYKYADEIIDIFTSLPNPIPVYRALKAKSEADIQLDFIGESWSFEKQSAINFGSRNGSNFLLSAMIDKKDVNWAGTIKAYTLFSGSYTDEDEHEIVIDDSSKLINLKISKLKEKVLQENYTDVNKLINDVKHYLLTEHNYETWEEFIDNQEMGKCQAIVIDIIDQFSQLVKCFGHIEIDNAQWDDRREEYNYLFTHHWTTFNDEILDFSKGTLKDYIEWNDLYEVGDGMDDYKYEEL